MVKLEHIFSPPVCVPSASLSKCICVPSPLPGVAESCPPGGREGAPVILGYSPPGNTQIGLLCVLTMLCGLDNALLSHLSFHYLRNKNLASVVLYLFHHQETLYFSSRAVCFAIF